MEVSFEEVKEGGGGREVSAQKHPKVNRGQLGVLSESPQKIFPDAELGVNLRGWRAMAANGVRQQEFE